MTQDVEVLGQAWANAELRGDVEVLDELLTDDFMAAGPLRFTLTRPQWLGRYRSGDFISQALSWETAVVRTYGDGALVVGKQVQQATYQGRPSNGQFRGTQVFVRRDGRWALAGMHLSPIAQPSEIPAAPHGHAG